MWWQCGVDQKAFDTVNQEILLYKLTAAGFSAAATK